MVKLWLIFMGVLEHQTFIKALLSTAVSLQFVYCLIHYLCEDFWNLDLQIAGMCISNTFSGCRSSQKGEYNGTSFKGFGYMKRLSFITQFKIEFSVPFTGCIKVLGKMLKHWYGSLMKPMFCTSCFCTSVLA